MDYRFRPDENKPPGSTYFPPFPSTPDTYFIEQALRAGYFGNDMRRVEFMRNVDPVREAIQREIEKERIREEIIATEILRKRALEAEVRRELAMERELSMRRTEGFSLVANSSSPSVWSESRIALLSNNTEDRVQEKFSFPSRPESGTVDRFPFQRHPEAAKLTEISKGSVVFLPKPLNVDHAGIKRKISSVGEGALAIGSSKKKPHKEWSCALCHVSATSEQGLNDHLRGKKHKSKETELLKANGATALRKQIRIPTTLPEKIVKLEVTKNTNSPNSEQGKEQEKESAQPNKKQKPKHKQKQAGKKNEEMLAQKKQKMLESKEKYKYWCANCNIGCHSSKVMDNHQAGKKHTAQLLKQMGGVFPNSSTTNTIFPNSSTTNTIFPNSSTTNTNTTLVMIGEASEEALKENNVDIEVDVGEQETEEKEKENTLETMESAVVDYDSIVRGIGAKEQEKEKAVDKMESAVEYKMQTPMVEKMEATVVDHDNIVKGVKVEIADGVLVDIQAAATAEVQGVEVEIADAKLIEIQAAEIGETLINA